MKIINIAMNCGFSTPSSFSKAFKQRYSMSPSEYRKLNTLNSDDSGKDKSKIGTSINKIGKEINTPVEYISDKDLENLYNRRKKMNVKIEKLPAYRIAYMRQIGPYGQVMFS
jgi:AraC family transcriptional regulator